MMCRTTWRSRLERGLSTPSARAWLRQLHFSTGVPTCRAVIGIRSEDPARIWERRVPLVPSDVARLVRQDGIQVLVQPSAKRAFDDAAYERVELWDTLISASQLNFEMRGQAGATITHDLSPASVIVGIKEVPIPEILSPSTQVPRRTYCFFSHTHKGQAYNRPLLKSMLQSKSRFLDWELLTNDEGIRQTAFGYLAGVAGMAEGLSGLGISSSYRGVSTPFLHLPRPYVYRSVKDLNHHLRRLGSMIEEHGTPPELGPITISISGRGRVSQGAFSVLDQLDCIQWVSRDELEALVKDFKRTSLKRIYACKLSLSDYVTHRRRGERGGLRSFDRAEYDSHPGNFKSDFATQVAPWTTLFVNGAFWQQGCPKILSDADMTQHIMKRLGQEPESWRRHRMLSVVDISCDFEGGLEFVKEATTICDPYRYIGPSGPTAAGGDTTQVIAIEILPSELPVDASEGFSKSIVPFVKALVKEDQVESEVARSLDRAEICENGKLASPHEWLTSTLTESSGGTSSNAEIATSTGKQHGREMKRILLLGSGLVAGPAAECLLARPDVKLTIATNHLPSARALVEPYAAAADRVSTVHIDLASSSNQLGSLVSQHDVVLSLLPAPAHVTVAEACIEHAVHLVTASYTSPGMKALHDKAVQADVILLNELGLDPGIDHMSAMSLLSAASSEKSRVDSFVSFCGGLPAKGILPSAGVLGYKFSWSPMGVLTATSNDATFRLEGQQVHIPGSELLEKRFSNVDLFPGYELEGLANRNSLGYVDVYGLDPRISTVLRGTLRYKGFCDVMNAFRKMGLLRSEPWTRRRPASWTELVSAALSETLDDDVAPHDVRLAMRTVLGAQAGNTDTVEQALAELGMMPASLITSDAPRCDTAATPLEALATLLAHALRYAPGERDLVLLHHEVGIVTEHGDECVLTSSLCAEGDAHGKGHSAMARTVGLPAALGALLVADGDVRGRGTVSAADGDVWRPLLGRVAEHGVVVREGRRRGRGARDALAAQMLG